MLNRGIQAGAEVVMRDEDCELREGLMKGVVKDFLPFASPEKKPPDGDFEHPERGSPRWADGIASEIRCAGHSNKTTQTQPLTLSLIRTYIPEYNNNLYMM